MIMSFANKLAEDLFDNRYSKEVRAFPGTLIQRAQLKLQYLNQAEGLEDLRVPPGNRLEVLKGNRAGSHSIRINDQWRLVFRWDGTHAHEVLIEDYH